MRPEGPSVLALDIGATKVASALVVSDGQILVRGQRAAHGNAGAPSVIAAAVRAARSCLASGHRAPRAVGVAVAAQVEPATGAVLHAPNLGWRDVPLGATIAEELQLPVRVVNDARAAVVAEWRLGAGAGYRDVFYLSLGTGVGGGAVSGGRLVEGARNAAGEVGHLTLVSGGRPCRCPNRGCLEAYVGGWAIAERALEAATLPGAEVDPLVALARSAQAVTARSVFDAAKAGDRLAKRIVRETEGYLADGAVGIVNAFNPECFILGGGLVAGRPRLVRVVREAIGRRCQPPAAGASVLAGKLGEDAPLIGAALAAFQLETSGTRS